MESLSLIDFSSEDDLLIPSADDCQRDLGSSENDSGDSCSAIALVGEDISRMSQRLEHLPEMSESPEQKRQKSGKVNLRKSLAWDSAFFTNEGVLNTEELAIVNSTFQKTETSTLPRIQEELQKSTESCSTLDTEGFTLENIEGDLFENLRASIQKSFGRPEDNSSVQPSSHQASRKKVELPSQNKAKPPVPLKRVGMNKKQVEHSSREAAPGVKEATKGSVDSKLSLKPPRIVPKPTHLSTVPSNKNSTGSLQMRNTARRTSSGNTTNRQGTIALNKTNGDLRGITSRSISSLRPTPGTVASSSASCLSNGMPFSSSSNLEGKSTLEPTRKRIAVRSSNQSLSASTTKTPVRSPKNKLGTSNLRISSRASPSSSIDSTISEASSSVSSSIKPTNSVESFASSTSSSLSLTVPAKTNASQSSDMHIASGQPCIKKDFHPGQSQIQPTSKASPGARILPGHVKSSSNGNAGTKSFKPSGLRMPSPKIGYFDAEKNLAPNSKQNSQTGLRNSLPKGNSGSTVTTGLNRPKSSKIPSIRPAGQHVSPKSHSLQGQRSPLSPHSKSPVSPLSQRQKSKLAQIQRDSSPVTREHSPGKVCKSTLKVADGARPQPAANKLVGNESVVSEDPVNQKGAVATPVDGVKKNTKLICGNKQGGRMPNEPHSVPANLQKENFVPAYGTNSLSRQALNGHVSAEDIMEKMSSLSVSEAGSFVPGG